MNYIFIISEVNKNRQL